MDGGRSKPQLCSPGIRSSQPVVRGEFHSMKGHAPFGFPAGRAQAYQTVEQLAHMWDRVPQRDDTQRYGLFRKELSGILEDDHGIRTTPRKLMRSSHWVTEARVAEITGAFSGIGRLEAAATYYGSRGQPHKAHRLRQAARAMKSRSELGQMLERQAAELDRGFTGKKVQSTVAGTTPGAGGNRPPSGGIPVGPMGRGKGQKFHDEVIDIETTGLRTRSRSGRFVGRGVSDRRIPLGITQITRRVKRGGKTHVHNYYTDILDKDLLSKWGLTMEQVDSGNVPEGFYRELTNRAGWRQGMRAPWDPSVQEADAVLQGVFRNSARETITGETHSTKSVLTEMMAEWKAMSKQGKTIRISGWNVQFDMSEIVMAMREHGLDEDISHLIAKNGIVAREMGENLHAMQFEHMLNSNWAPTITDRSALQVAYNMGVTELDDAAYKRLGAKGISPMRTHSALRSFMDDVREGRSAFKSRAQTWIASQQGGTLTAERTARNLVGRLSKIKTYEDFTKFAAQIQKESHNVVYRDSSLYDVLGEMYPTEKQGLKHVHILGDPDTLGAVNRFPSMFGKVHGFSMIGGGKLETTVSTLLAHQEKLGVDTASAARLQELVGRAHDSAADTEMSEIVFQQTGRIRRDKTLSKLFMQEQEHVHRARVQDRLGQLWQDIVGNPKSAELGGAKQIGKQLAGGGRRMGRDYASMLNEVKGPGWAKMIGGIAAMYIIGSHNEIEKPEPMHAMRRPNTQFDMIEGIDTSSLPFSNISAFGSGYDPFVGNVIHASNLHQHPLRNRYTEDPRVAARIKSNPVVMGGERVHGIIQSELKAAGLLAPHGVEYVVEAHGIQGHIDALLRGGIPLELKSVENEQALWNLKGPKDKHISQVNFYAHAMHSPYAYIMYASRSNPQARRIFRVEYDARRLSADMAYVSKSLAEGKGGVNKNWIGAFVKAKMSALVANARDMVGLGTQYTGEDPFMWQALGSIANQSYGDVGGAVPSMATRMDGGYGGYVQRLSAHANKSRVRDYQTQMMRLPGQIRTPKGRQAMSSNSHAEREFAGAAGGYIA